MIRKQINLKMWSLNNLLSLINDFPHPFLSNNQYTIAYWGDSIKVPLPYPHLKQKITDFIPRSEINLS